MKTLLNHPFIIYCIAGFASFCIMVIIDYLLGAEAEHLNAWAILNRLAGRDPGIEDSLAIRRFGLAGATFLMLLINSAFGVILIQILRMIIDMAHS